MGFQEALPGGPKNLQSLWVQGQSLAHFRPADSSFSPLTSLTNGFPLLWKSMVALARRSGFTRPPHPQTPTLSPFSGQFRKNFFSWTSPIEPCQEKIILQARKRAVCREQKDGEGGSGKRQTQEQGEQVWKGRRHHSYLELNHSPRMPVVSAWPAGAGGGGGGVQRRSGAGEGRE